MKELVYPRERTYFALCTVISVLLYIALAVTVVGIFYILLAAVMVLFINGIYIGTIRTNAVKVSARQFPEVYVKAQELAQKMEMELPDIYVLQAGGSLNAMATRFLGRDFMIIFSDVLEMAYEEGEAALTFVIAHELAHIKRKHLSMRWLIYPGLLIPFLGTAYMRACEYTCDRFGANYVPEGAVKGLLVLAAGKQLYRKMDVAAFVQQTETEKGFFVWLAEVVATHPPLAERVRAAETMVGERQRIMQTPVVEVFS